MTELRPLGEIMEVLEKKGLVITYAYDDLLFVEHIPFLLRFDNENNRLLYYYAHADLETEKSGQLLQTVTEQLRTVACEVRDGGTFDLTENNEEKENLDITFYDKGETV